METTAEVIKPFDLRLEVQKPPGRELGVKIPGGQISSCKYPEAGKMLVCFCKSRSKWI